MYLRRSTLIQKRISENILSLVDNMILLVLNFQILRHLKFRCQNLKI